MTLEYKPEVEIGRDRTASQTPDPAQLEGEDTNPTDPLHQDLLASTGELAGVLPPPVAILWVDILVDILVPIPLNNEVDLVILVAEVVGEASNLAGLTSQRRS